MANTIPMESVSLEAASLIVDRALAKGRAMSFKPLAVAVLDPRGCLKATTVSSMSPALATLR